MTVTNLIAVRRLSGKIGAILCGLIALILIDSLVSRFTDPFNVIHVVRGGHQVLTGVLPEQAETLDDLLFVSETPRVSVEFLEIFTGFWLGNPMFRGNIVTSPDTAPGEYRIKIRGRHQLIFNPALTYEVRIYSDESALQKSHGPFLKRRLGIGASQSALILFPALGAVVLFNYLLSSILENRMAETGRAEIYMMKRSENGFRVAFSLGTTHGITIGETVDILDGTETPIAEAVVRMANKGDSIAETESSLDIRQTVMVQRRLSA